MNNCMNMFTDANYMLTLFLLLGQLLCYVASNYYVYVRKSRSNKYANQICKHLLRSRWYLDLFVDIWSISPLTL